MRPGKVVMKADFTQFVQHGQPVECMVLSENVPLLEEIEEDEDPSESLEMKPRLV
jgi:hypothetical protein